MRRLTVSTLPGRLGFLVEDGVKTGGMVTIDAAGALDKIILRFSFKLTAGADWRAVVTGPSYPSIDEYREFGGRAGIVQRGAADATSAQLLVAFSVVVIADHRGTETLLAYR